LHEGSHEGSYEGLHEGSYAVLGSYLTDQIVKVDGLVKVINSYKPLMSYWTFPPPVRFGETEISHVSNNPNAILHL